MRSISVKYMLVNIDTVNLCTSCCNGQTVTSCRHELPRHEHLKFDAKPANLRCSICLVRHEPHHSLCTYTTIRMPKVIRIDCRMAHHHRGTARHDQDACSGTHRSLQGRLDSDERRFHIGVPNLRKAFPILFVNQGRMQTCAGIKNQNVRSDIRDGTIDHCCHRCIASDTAGSNVVGITELVTVPCYYRDLRTSLHQGSCHFQSDALAPTRDYYFCSFQVNHIRSFL